MGKKELSGLLRDHLVTLKSALEVPEGSWVVKGFIDVYKNIYTLSVDTKVVSKVIELMLFPLIASFAARSALKMVLSEYQNHYPDITFIADDGSKYAIDIKSTYRTGKNTVNGFTLGAFTGYFHDRTSTKNITYPYDSYCAHFVLGVIYTANTDASDERIVLPIERLLDIVSVARDFKLILQEKWCIASDRPGSGNTKNIGSINNIDDLESGNGTFAKHGEKVFDDYWLNYLTRDMAKLIETSVRYKNISEYLKWRKR